MKKIYLVDIDNVSYAYLSKIDKVIYCKSSNNYKVYLASQKYNLNFFISVYVSDAKNIVLAKENINSDKLKTYDFIVNLLSILSVEIDRIVISKNKNNIIASIFFKSNNIKNKINISLVDAIILSIKTFSGIYIQKELFDENNTIKFLDNKTFKNKSKINNLKNILALLIKNEEYESAALLRNKINKISN